MMPAACAAVSASATCAPNTHTSRQMRSSENVPRAPTTLPGCVRSGEQGPDSKADGRGVAPAGARGLGGAWWALLLPVPRSGHGHGPLAGAAGEGSAFVATA